MMLLLWKGHASLHQFLKARQMGETAASNSALQVSVSFGRFENDSLSWEKWSSFSPNKYLEEVEKCATPGSVAQKKAYFEAHYKSVAARKAELQAQEKQMEKAYDEDLRSCNTCGTDAEFDMSNALGFSEGVKQEANSIGEIVTTHVSNFEEDVAVSRDYQSLLVEGDKEELESRSRSSQIDKHEEVVCGEQEVNKEESPNVEAEDVKEISLHVNNETAKASEIEAKHVTLNHPKVSKKATPVKRESNTAKMKKSVLPTTKATHISTPRSSKPTSTPTKTLASASSAKRGSSPSISGRKITSTGENRKVPNKSLHMSLSLAPSKPDPAPDTTMRKSLFMEKMGDKDIVKRAFKTFQNHFNQPKTSGEDKSLVKEKVSPKGTEPRIMPTSIALRKENGQSPKLDSMEKRSGNAVQTTSGLKSDLRAEKGKEFPRKIEEKFTAKEVERMHAQFKLKEEKLKHNSKATALPAFHRGQKASKSHPEKGDVKIEKWR
ncbi:hypothetical protein VNO77_04163 [Canavalia gladiata]|uniref:Protein WVD2-like 7 n=1 Tax=Canavalia gladiata TaxID=3824 RepID=A0AAN9N2J5_CANGL